MMKGEAGRRKFMQYSRVITIPIAAIQGIGFLLFLATTRHPFNLSPRLT